MNNILLQENYNKSNIQLNIVAKKTSKLIKINSWENRKSNCPSLSGNKDSINKIKCNRITSSRKLLKAKKDNKNKIINIDKMIALRMEEYLLQRTKLVLSKDKR